jgi:hypothetical protein
LNWEKNEATLRLFEERLVFFVEIDVANKALAVILNTLTLSIGRLRGIAGFLSNVEGLGVEANVDNRVCHLGRVCLEKGGRSGDNRHGCSKFKMCQEGYCGSSVGTVVVG